MNLSRFDLNLLVALNALLIERNVTRAGERINLSQPAMSGTLSRLRAAFKDELLVRVGRQLELTPLAQDLAPQLRQQLQGIEDLINSRRSFVPETEERTFIIAASDYATFMILQPLISLVSERAPQVTIHFARLNAESPSKLQDDNIDFGIFPSEIEYNFPSEPLFSDRWVCSAWKDNPYIGTTLTEDLFVSLRHLSHLYDNLESMADVRISKLGIARNIAASTESFILAPFMLKGTDLITMLPERVARSLEHPAELRILECPYDLPVLHEQLCWNPRRTDDPSHVWLRQQFAEAARFIPCADTEQ